MTYFWQRLTTLFVIVLTLFFVSMIVTAVTGHWPQAERSLALMGLIAFAWCSLWIIRWLFTGKTHLT